MHYICVISLLYGLFIDIRYVRYVKIKWTPGTIQAYDKFENLKILLYFFNKDISFEIP